MTSMPAATLPVGQSGVAGYPAGTRNLSRTYFVDGRQRTASRPVPVTEFGVLNGVEWRCRKSKVSRWYGVAIKGVPVCECHGLQMVQVAVTAPPLLPWSDMWASVNRPLRPVWALAGAAAAGYAVDAADIPALALVGAAPAAGWLARWATRKVLVGVAVKKGRLEHEDPDGDRRLRAAIDRQARTVGYTTAGGTLALALAAACGMDLTTWPGRLAAAAVLAAWLPAAGTWWRKLRLDRARPAPLPVVEDEAGESAPSMNPDEAEVRRIWGTVLARLAQKGPDGQTRIKAGKLAGTWLEDWHKVDGGWAATICSQPGDYVTESFLGARGAIASAFRMKATMITVIPDGDDETQALVLAQRTSPIGDVVRWSGPDSIDVEAGVAEMARYVDGSPTLYELYRPGWGSPHDFLCGTTGAGKSEALSMLLLIDRWAHHTDEHGRKHGIVADLLIDPQQGQSYEPFMDDLAAPVATSLDEAFLLVEAFKREMLRRNAYLSKKGWKDPRTGIAHRPEWLDKRGRRRYGRKWWNPLVDGPILVLNIDEAHEYLANRDFAHLVTSGARMYRKCGMRVRVATHTPLLTDLGGSMALRDMLTGGFVWVGRTANSLSGPTAFNGRMPVDPRTIEAVPGTAFILTGPAPKAMKARTMWEPDFYDWVRDDNDEPIGFPAPLPEFTRFAFGKEFAKWETARRDGDETWTPPAAASPEPVVPATAVTAVLKVLRETSEALSTDDLDSRLAAAGTRYSTGQLRAALRELRDKQQLVVTSKRGTANFHQLTSSARQRFAGDQAVDAEQQALFAAEVAA